MTFYEGVIGNIFCLQGCKEECVAIFLLHTQLAIPVFFSEKYVGSSGS